jgi:prevent-host-death family protein
MNTIAMSQLVSISELQRDYASLVARVKRLATPLFLLRRNQPEAVLVSVPVYEELVEKRRLYEEEMALKAIAKFDKAKKEGKLLVATKAEDFFE